MLGIADSILLEVCRRPRLPFSTRMNGGWEPGEKGSHRSANDENARRTYDIRRRCRRSPSRARHPTRWTASARPTRLTTSGSPRPARRPPWTSSAAPTAYREGTSSAPWSSTARSRRRRCDKGSAPSSSCGSRARARSTLECWPRVTLPTHPAHNLSTLREFASFAAELPRRYPRAWNGTTYQRIIALAWEQSRYVNKCTTVLCLGPELEAAFQLLCHSSLPLAHLNNASTVVAAQGPHSQPAEPTEAECAPIRRLYETDDSLWRTHCGSQAYAWAGRLLDRFEPGLAALGASPGRGRV